MRRLRRAWRVSGLAVLFVSATLTLGLTSVTTPAAHAASTGVAPNAVGELDCNGLSPIQHPVKPAVMCKDPRGTWNGRFYENGKYIGHDEPSMRFVSNQAGSGRRRHVHRAPAARATCPADRAPTPAAT